MTAYDPGKPAHQNRRGAFPGHTAHQAYFPRWPVRCQAQVERGVQVGLHPVFQGVLHLGPHHGRLSGPAPGGTAGTRQPQHPGLPQGLPAALSSRRRLHPRQAQLADRTLRPTARRRATQRRLPPHVHGGRTTELRVVRAGGGRAGLVRRAGRGAYGRRPEPAHDGDRLQRGGGGRPGAGTGGGVAALDRRPEPERPANRPDQPATEAGAGTPSVFRPFRRVPSRERAPRRPDRQRVRNAADDPRPSGSAEKSPTFHGADRQGGHPGAPGHPDQGPQLCAVRRRAALQRDRGSGRRAAFSGGAARQPGAGDSVCPFSADEAGDQPAGFGPPGRRDR